VSEPPYYCGVPGCSRPGFWWGVCSSHRREEVAWLHLMEELENQRTDEDLEAGTPIKIAAVPLRWQSEGGTPYGRAVLRNHLTKVATTTEGSRNERLSQICYLVGGYVAGGEITLAVAAEGLALAAAAAGLARREYQDTIRRQLKAGFKEPLTAPAR
jgi:hypothetical protein